MKCRRNQKLLLQKNAAEEQAFLLQKREGLS